MIGQITGSNAITVTASPGGGAICSSTHPWYRFLSALVDLYLSGLIDEDWLQNEATACTQAVSDSGDKAAWRLLNRIFLPSDEGAEDYRERLLSILFTEAA